MRMRSENKGEKYLVKMKIRGPNAKPKGRKVRLRPLELFSFLFHVLQQSLFTLMPIFIFVLLYIYINNDFTLYPHTLIKSLKINF